MPLYEYLCKDCNEMLVENKALEERDNAPECVTCNQPMKRMFGSPGVSFKGSGFYTTDK